jgi:hypothetical protein
MHIGITFSLTYLLRYEIIVVTIEKHELNGVYYIMSLHLLPKKTSTFIPWQNQINSMFEDQVEHIIEPVENHAKKCLITPDERQALLVCPPGSGKTTMFLIDLVWRIADQARKNNINNQLIVFTSPDGGLKDDMFYQLDELFKDNWAYEELTKRGINLCTVSDNTDDIKGRGLEIIVLLTNSFDDNSKHFENLKNHKITSIISEEVHRELGCTDSRNYTGDVGHDGRTYEAKRYWNIRSLNYSMWFGVTGTPTDSQKTDTENFTVLSDKMERSEWRLPFFAENYKHYSNYPLGDNGLFQLVEDVFVEISKRNAISKYLLSEIDLGILSKLSIELQGNLKATKSTCFLKCFQANSRYSRLDVDGVMELWGDLCEKYKSLTFDYDGVKLPYHIGRIAEMTHKSKTGGTNGGTIDLLNDPDSEYVAVAAIHIGAVGINITNLACIGILSLMQNNGDVGITPEQLICRLDRSKFVWRGSFADEVSKISDSSQRNKIINLAINLSSKNVFSNQSKLVTEAYNNTLPNHVKIEDAVGYLTGLVSIFREQNGYSSVSGKERDIAYKNEQKPRCEFPDCGCYEELVEDSNELSKPIREIYYQQSLNVDHKDGDRENMNPDNLITLCPNRHSFKTMENKDYLKKYYEKNDLIITPTSKNTIHKEIA